MQQILTIFALIKSIVMTIQQLTYIIALDKYRSFAKAAEHCGVTQPTLSKMVAKLEEELDVRIFDRTNRHVSPTATGIRIIHQALHAVQETERIREIAEETRSTVGGELRMSVGPSIAPYILPGFIRLYSAGYPCVSFSIEELRLQNMLDALECGSVDMAIATGGNSREGMLEIPLYNEPFWVYLSAGCVSESESFAPDELDHENMWVMKEAQCLRESAFSFCKARDTGHRVYEAGNIETLVRVVDANGGFTIIPEMHLPLLTASQRENVRPLVGECLSMRRVSMYIRQDYVREKMLNSVVDTLKKVVPPHMWDPFVQKGNIRI